MKATMRALALIGILALSAISFAQSVSGSLLNYRNVPLAVTWPAFNSGTASSNPFSIAGLNYFQVVAVVNGSVSACSVSVDGATAVGGSFTTGSVIPSATIGSCASSMLYVTGNAVTPAVQGRITVTITGSGSVTLVVLGYHSNPALSCPN